MKFFKNKKIIFLFFFIFFVVVLLIGYNEVNDGSDIYKSKYHIKNYIPKNLKKFLKGTIFIHATFKQKENEIKKLEDLVKQKDYIIIQKDNRLDILYDKFVKKKFFEIEKIEFKNFTDREILEIEPLKLKLKIYQNDLLFDGKNLGALSSGYLADFNNDIVISSGYQFFYFNINDLEKDKFTANKISSNLRNLLNNSDFEKVQKNIKKNPPDREISKAGFGIKDIAIIDDNLYLSYTNLLTDECYNTSILVAKYNNKFLKFEKFFEPNECVKKNNEYGLFTPYIAGGRIIDFNSNEILFSTGTFNYRDHAQNKENVFGKILSINKKNKDYKIISMGHRNPQGLFFDKSKNVLVSTEHGPMGGDEVNINNNLAGDIENFGWPISSYGGHYKYHIANKKAPLHKSHSEYGFIEPIHFFTPSIGISEVIKIPSNFNKNFTNDFFVTSLGQDVREGDMSIHHFRFDDSYEKILELNQIKINERIRDIIYVERINKVLVWLETSGSLGLISNDTKN